MPNLPKSDSNLPLKPHWFQAPFGGLDRLNFDPDPEASSDQRKKELKKKGVDPKHLPAQHSLDRTVREGWMRTWFQSVYETSSFNFAGVYLKSPGKNKLLTTASQTKAHGWTLNWDKIQQDGWMIWPIYQGYSNSPRQPGVWPKDPVDWERTKVARGTEAGKHIKTILSQIPGDNSGIIVYIDNEEGPTTKGTDLERPRRKSEPEHKRFFEKSRDLLPYYRALFDEMQTDRQDSLTAVRAGLYIRQGFIAQVTAMFPDLYLWLIETQTGTLPDRKKAGDNDGDKRKAQGFAHQTPITSSQTTDKFKSQHFDIERYPIPFERIPYLSIGRQCTLTGETAGFTDSVVMGENGGVRSPVQGWDFDVSFVHDPRYPQAGARFLTTGPGSIIGNTYSKAQSVIRESGNQSWHVPIENAEPGAPLALLELELYTVDTGGQLITSRKDETTREALSGKNPWTNPEVVISENLDLRRLRAFAVNTASLMESLIFYISKQNKIQVCRRAYRVGDDINKPIPWKRAGAWEIGALHPFTNMTTATFQGLACLFYMQSTGEAPAQDGDVKLPTSTCKAALSVGVWPNTGSSQLGITLKGTAIAAVATNNHLFTFVVGIDHTLLWSYAILDPKSKSLRWTPLTPFKTAALTPTSKVVFLHPHTRLSACAVSPTLINVAGLSRDGIPSVFEFLFTPSTGSPSPVSQWTASSCVQHPRNTTDTGTGSAKGFTLAKGWTFNPYGDIVLVQTGSFTVLFCAAATAGKSGIMMKRLFDNSKGMRLPLEESWLRLRDG